MNKTMEKIGRIVYNNRIIISMILLVFTLGFFIGTAASAQKNEDLNTEFIIDEQQPNTNNQEEVIQIGYDSPQEIPSPQDRVLQDDILVYDNQVIINIKEPEWATFTDTNSMDPIIDAGANAIEIIPKQESELQVGDIISYESEYATGTIIHRITEIGQDQEGWYCRTKGDNLDSTDPGKIRFSQIRRVVVAIIY